MVDLGIVPHEQQTKPCTKCAARKPLTDFYRQAKARDGRHSLCKHCHNRVAKNWRKAHPDKVSKYKRNEYLNHRESHRRRAKGWYQRHREEILERTRKYTRENWDKARDARFRRAYGVTLDDVNAMIEAQGGVCAICRDPSRMSKNKGLVVDHCHKTGRVRGVLCPRCNKGIGLFDDNPEILRSVISYLGAA